MLKRNDIFKCEVCGNIVSGRHDGAGELVCCGKPMVRMIPDTVEASREKHIPVAQKVQGGLNVKVGEVPHPMTEAHYIEWIEIIAGDKNLVHYLAPGEAPETVFSCCGGCKPGTEPIIRAYCNLHGLWATQTINGK